MDHSTSTPEPRYGSGSTQRCVKTTAFYSPASDEAFRAALLELEQFSNELISEGAVTLRFMVLAIPDRHKNPDAALRQLRVAGLRPPGRDPLTPQNAAKDIAAIMEMARANLLSGFHWSGASLEEMLKEAASHRVPPISPTP